MLRLDKLLVENFGPFKGKQELKFPAAQGVSVVYGENRRGKTSLLNAIRFAFLARVVTRGSIQLPFNKVLNTEAAAEGARAFSVTLQFHFENHAYVLTRRCEMRPGVDQPAGPNDFVTTTFLTKNGQPFSQDETTHELSRIMPPDIARFFLFDGELLSEYEELLRDHGANDVGKKISAAIEQILGLPVLQNLRIDIEELAEQAHEEEGKAAQRDNKTKQLGVVLEQLTVQLRHLKDDQGKLVYDHEAKLQRKAELAGVLNRSQRLATLIEAQNNADARISELETTLVEKKQKLQVAMAGAWGSLLSQVVSPFKASKESRLMTLRKEH